MIDIEQYMLWVWLALFVIAFIVEASTQELVSIWFGIGSLVALCVCGFAPFWVEFIVFSVVTVVALLLTRPLVKKLMDRNVRFTNSDENVGRLVLLEKEVTKFNPGEVRLSGIVYTAILPENSVEEISKGSVVEIVAFKGNKVVIKKVNSNNEEEVKDVFNE